MSDELEARLQALLEASDLAAAATEAVRGYGPEVAGYLRAVLRDRGAADEVFAWVCEKLWRSLGSFRGESSLRTWLYRLAFNAARDHERAEGRRRVRRLRTSEISRVALEVLSSHAASAEAALERLRATLAPDEQTLLTLRVHARLSWREIAAIVALDEAAVRKRFERLKVKLRKRAAGEGLLR